MNELIKVDFTQERPAVSARELHSFLEVGADYRHWFPRMCEYGFTEGEDFNSVKIDRVQQEGIRMVSRTIDDAALSIDMAKEICMLQRNEKGKQARQYFLQLEKDWNSPEKVMARALQIADRKIKRLEEKVEADRPKVAFSDAVAGAQNSIIIRELAKILRQNGVDIGEKRLFDWMRKNGYLIKAKGSDYNRPTQRSVDAGWMEQRETAVSHAAGTRTHFTPLITGKGQQYFLNLFLSRKAIDNRKEV
jgi:anti-repressor protein